MVREVVDGEAGDDGVELAEGGSVLSRSWATTVTLRSRGEEFLSVSSMAGEKSSATKLAAGRAALTSESSLPPPLPMSRMRRGSGGHELKQCGFALDAVRDRVGAAQILEACSAEDQRLTSGGMACGTSY